MLKLRDRRGHRPRYGLRELYFDKADCFAKLAPVLTKETTENRSVSNLDCFRGEEVNEALCLRVGEYLHRASAWLRDSVGARYGPDYRNSKRSKWPGSA